MGALHTDELRALSVWLYDESQDDRSQLASAAADEMDRLRAAVHAGEYLASSNNHLWKVIEDAPHQLDCSMQTHGGACDCWKAQVL